MDVVQDELPIVEDGMHKRGDGNSAGSGVRESML
jgi:hypothetical protein